MRRPTSLRSGDREAGFTLTELLVVMGLMGLILGTAYMFSYTVRVGQAQAEREAKLARAVGVPLLTMERLLVQNSAIDPLYSPSGTQVTILTDQDSDDVLEQHTISVSRDPFTGEGFVDLVSYRVDAAGVRIGAPTRNGHIGYSNANIRDSLPLFRYYDKDGVEITDYGAVSHLARSMVIELRISIDGVSETQSDTVHFRNR